MVVNAFEVDCLTSYHEQMLHNVFPVSFDLRFGSIKKWGSPKHIFLKINPVAFITFYVKVDLKFKLKDKIIYFLDCYIHLVRH